MENPTILRSLDLMTLLEYIFKHILRLPNFRSSLDTDDQPYHILDHHRYDNYFGHRQYD